MLDGRVENRCTRKIHGGLLYIRGQPGTRGRRRGSMALDRSTLSSVNLYPFEQTIAKPGVTLEDAIENIDIGGPAMLRSAAKNHESVTVVMDPMDYAEVADQVKEQGNTTLEMRRTLATRVFARTSAYDATIASHLIKVFGIRALPPRSGDTVVAARSTELPDQLRLDAELAQSLRYGENPHQRAALYGRFREYFDQLHGKELSYNNILDLTAAAALIGEFSADRPTLAILKHTNPCGVGQGRFLARGVGPGLRHGQTGALRWHHCGQSHP
jgi:phosphoribosylaminoimidazolecarboxamide formyltransferase/IMP cyclohydrolase